MSDDLTGRELDAAIATQCFGIKVVWKNGEPFRFPREWGESYSVPRYSDYMHFTWQVAEWIREQAGPEFRMRLNETPR